MAAGVFFGLLAGLIWGLVYVIPLLLPDYGPLEIAFMRYAIFGSASLVLALRERERFAALGAAGWRAAAALGIVGNIGYYAVLVAAVKTAGVPVAGAFTALVPVTVALTANHLARREGSREALPWGRILPPLAVVFAGMVCLNFTEFSTFVLSGAVPAGRFAFGVGLAALSLVIWTWYPIANTRWLARHASLPASVGVTAQGVTLLPAALAGLAALAAVSPEGAAGVLGPTPVRFAALAAVLGLLCSWAAILCWNLMSRRLPAALGGQFIIFETLFAVIYAHVLRGAVPTGLMTVGMVLLLAGILWAAAVFRSASRKRSRERAL